MRRRNVLGRSRADGLQHCLDMAFHTYFAPDIQDFAVYKTNEREFKLDDEKSITARLEDGKLFVSFFGQEDVIFDLMPAIEKILADNPAREPLTEPYVLDIAGKGFLMQYHISNIAGDIEDQKPVVSNLVGQAFITLR